jgi:ATP-binding cassette subfamily F protein uup
MAAVNLLNLESVSKSFDIRALLDEVSLGVNAGDRIGVVGRNGGGKSTLIKVMAGIEAPDSGRVSKAGSVNIGILSQTDDLSQD